LSPQFTGAHLLHLAVAACVLNDLYREAANTRVRLTGVRVDAEGSFDTESWRSTGASYRIQVDQQGGAEDELAALVSMVDDVAEIPRALRSGVDVARTELGPRVS
jgi:uncharacterized OsmC-like protein